METERYRIEDPSGETDAVELPEGLVGLLADEGEEGASVVAEVALMAFVERAHAIAHHSEGETPDHVAEINEAAEALFEERFGVSFADAMGHDH